MKRINLLLTTLAAIFLVSIFLRFSFLTADPIPYTLSGATWFDEGSYVHNARNLVLFGSLYLENDAWNPVFLSPTYTYLSILFFKLFGLGTFSMRLLPSILGIISILIVGSFLIAKNFEKGLIYMAILVINSMLIAYSRIAIPEAVLLFFIMIIFGLMIQNKQYSWFMIGLLTPFLFFSKITSLFFVVSIPISLFFHSLLYKSKVSFKKLRLFIFGAAISLLFWIIWLIPNLDNWILMNFGNHGDRIGTSVTELGVASLTSFEFILLDPIIAISTIIMLLFIFIQVKKRRRVEILDLFLVVLLITFTMQIILVDYSLRRFVLLVPILAYFAAELISKIRDSKIEYKEINLVIDGKKIIILILLFYIIISLANLAPYYANILKDPNSAYTLKHNSQNISNYIPFGAKVYGRHATALSLENGIVTYFGDYESRLGNKDKQILPLMQNKEINYAILKINIFDDKERMELGINLNKSSVHKYIYDNFEIIAELNGIHTRTNEPDTKYIYRRIYNQSTYSE